MPTMSSPSYTSRSYFENLVQLKEKALYVRQLEEASYFASDITSSFIAMKVCISNLYNVPTLR